MGKGILAEHTTGAKALGQDPAWCVKGTGKGPVWLEQSEREERRKRGGREWGRSSRALWAMEKMWVFYLKGGGNPEGLWAEGGWVWLRF